MGASKWSRYFHRESGEYQRTLKREVGTIKTRLVLRRLRTLPREQILTLSGTDQIVYSKNLVTTQDLMLIWPSDQLPQKVAFLSDLHLFSTRSTAEKHRLSMLDVARQAEVIVFGGDLFDVRWSRVGDNRATAQAATDWLSTFTRQAGARKYVYLYGNHDGDQQLRDELSDWAGSREDFQIAGDLLRINDTIFLHGDAIEGTCDTAGLQDYRTRWAGKPQASLNQSRAYDAAISTGAHRLVAAVAHRRRRTFKRLLRYLDHHNCGAHTGIRRVVFGHTHRFIPGLSFAGIRFYNPGATVRGVPFQPVYLDLSHTHA